MLICMCGAAGTGKSTVAREYARRYSGVIVSTDAIREELFGSAAEQKSGNLVFKIAYERIKDALYFHRTVIFDATNLTPSYRKKVLEVAKPYNKGFTMVVVMTTDIEEAKKRNQSRDRIVPDDVIERQFNKFVKPTEEEGWDIIRFV